VGGERGGFRISRRSQRWRSDDAGTGRGAVVDEKVLSMLIPDSVSSRDDRHSLGIEETRYQVPTAGLQYVLVQLVTR